jgi:hypothetical protein
MTDNRDYYIEKEMEDCADRMDWYWYTWLAWNINLHDKQQDEEQIDSGKWNLKLVHALSYIIYDGRKKSFNNYYKKENKPLYNATCLR